MVKIVTDTSANLPRELVEKYGITVLPFQYTVDGVPVEYSDDWNADGKRFFEAMRAGAVVDTSLVNMGRFIDCFEPMLQAGNDVIYIGMSSGISGTYNASRLAAEELNEKYTANKVIPYDTYGAGLGEGLMVLKAVEMAEAGKSVDEINEYLLARRQNLCQYFSVGDLKYLQRTGRVSMATAIVGNMLGIKPILVGDETGHIVAYAKERGLKRVLQHLVDKFEELVEDKSHYISMSHADCPEITDQLLAMLRERGFTGECISSMWEPVTGSHVGPGSIALFFWGKRK
ncbi:MAG: DegV family protein [Oscillospiraceae bacterium]|nr:DegV family protein [Oscillospiraceae bacterium]